LCNTFVFKDALLCRAKAIFLGLTNPICLKRDSQYKT
jgi:hypothetical protein